MNLPDDSTLIKVNEWCGRSSNDWIMGDQKINFRDSLLKRLDADIRCGYVNTGDEQKYIKLYIMQHTDINGNYSAYNENDDDDDEKRDLIFNLISEERNKQLEKWGDQKHSDIFWLMILMEEVGELADSIDPQCLSLIKDLEVACFMDGILKAIKTTGKNCKSALNDFYDRFQATGVANVSKSIAGDFDINELIQVLAVGTAWGEEKTVCLPEIPSGFNLLS